MSVRRANLLAAVAAAALMAGGAAAPGFAASMKGSAAPKTVVIGWDGSLTGGDAEGAILQQYGAEMAVADINAKKMLKGVTLKVMSLDDGTATAGQYDPVQAATNARKFVADKTVVGIIGPQMSGAAKAMTPILSMADLAMITPSATNPDLTNPQFKQQYDPGGKPVFFRTVATDAYQGPEMANYFAKVLKVKSVYVLDDSGAYGEGLADAFQKQAAADGIKVLGRDKLDPKAADYSAILTKIKSMSPDSLYYGGVMQAGVKLVKQSYDILPNIIKGGGDGIQDPEMFTGAGFPAATGWYATVASPHVNEEKSMAAWVKRYTDTYGKAPDDYAVCSYDATMALAAAIQKVQKEKKTIDRESVLAALPSVKIKTLQGPVSFDANGDLEQKVISVFQAEHNPAFPLDDLAHQYKYLGVAPQSA
jgi:branched-chain amino acid transport system substrate-binding protein